MQVQVSLAVVHVDADITLLIYASERTVIISMCQGRETGSALESSSNSSILS